MLIEIIKKKKLIVENSKPKILPEKLDKCLKSLNPYIESPDARKIYKLKKYLKGASKVFKELRQSKFSKDANKEFLGLFTDLINF